MTASKNCTCVIIIISSPPDITKGPLILPDELVRIVGPDEYHAKYTNSNKVLVAVN